MTLVRVAVVSAPLKHLAPLLHSIRWNRSTQRLQLPNGGWTTSSLHPSTGMVCASLFFIYKLCIFYLTFYASKVSISVYWNLFYSIFNYYVVHNRSVYLCHCFYLCIIYLYIFIYVFHKVNVTLYFIYLYIKYVYFMQVCLSFILFAFCYINLLHK